MLITLLAAQAQPPLPVKRIRFYETGVGWFERSGRVDEATELPVPTSHLDDALKTLVILGGDVEVGAVTFASAVGGEAARVSAGLQTPNPDFASTLRSLQGTRVELKTAAGVEQGVLMNVEGPLPAPTSGKGEATAVAAQYALTVLSKEGMLLRTRTDDLVSIRALDPGVAARLQIAAESLSQTRAQSGNALDLQLWGGGRLSLGYLAEAPVWRVSYRVLLGEESALQAWALVHNDTDEAWDGVTIELANGEPDSFLFPLAAPRYAARDLRTPEENWGTVPQLANSTADEMWNGDQGGIGSGSFGAGGAGSAASVGGVGHGSVGTVPAKLKEAEPVQTPTQFVYRVARPLDLSAHHSALVSLVHQNIPAEGLVVFAPHGKARTGLWLENTTDRTLPAGVISVMEAGGLTGESQLERLKPGETQMLQLGNELDVDLAQTVSSSHRPDSLAMRGDQLVLTTRRTDAAVLEIHNRSGRPRDLWVGLEVPAGAALDTELRTEIDPHAGWSYAVVPSEPGESSSVVSWSEPQEEGRPPESWSTDDYAAWVELGLSEGTTLTRALRIRTEIDGIDSRLDDTRSAMARAQNELRGLRASLSAASGDGSALPRRAAQVEAEVRKFAEREADLREERKKLVADLRLSLAGGVAALLRELR